MPARSRGADDASAHTSIKAIWNGHLLMGTHLYPPLYPPTRRRCPALLASAVVAVVDRLELALPRLVEQRLHMSLLTLIADRLIDPHADGLAEQLFGAHGRPVLAVGLGFVADLVEPALHPAGVISSSTRASSCFSASFTAGFRRFSTACCFNTPSELSEYPAKRADWVPLPVLA